MLDPKITELADRIIQLQFHERTKQLEHDILLTQTDAAVRGMGTSSAMVEVVYNHCARNVELRTSTVWKTLKKLLSETDVDLSETLRSDLRNQVQKYQEAIVGSASKLLDTVATNAGFPWKPLTGALEHALAKVHADIDLFMISLRRPAKVSQDAAQKKDLRNISAVSM